LVVRALHRDVSEQRPDESPVRRLMDALDVAHNARIGVGVGVVFVLLGVALVVYSPYRGSYRLNDLVLAFVVLVSTSVLATVVLTLRAAARLTMSPPKWIRRGGTAAAVGGGAWLAMAVVAPLGAGIGIGIGIGTGVQSMLKGTYARLLPLIPLVLSYGLWAVHASNKRRYGYHGLAGAVVTLVGFALLVVVGLAEPGGFLGEPLETVGRWGFLSAHLVALGGTSLLGTAVVRVGELPSPGGLATTLSLPAALCGLAAATVLRAPELIFPALGGPLGVAWLAVGYYLRTGRGIPPEEAFEVGIDLRAR